MTDRSRNPDTPPDWFQLDRPTEQSPSLKALPPTPNGCILYVARGGPGDQGRSIRATTSPILIGRDERCDLQLLDSSISRTHTELTLVPGGVRVRDLNSVNGTEYLGRRIEAAVLPLGARIRLGNCDVDVLPLENDVAIAASQRTSYGPLVGDSLLMRRLYALLEALEHSDATVLIQGETGTGKELVASAIHEHGPRKNGPFVVVDCGNLPSSLMESELFGHKRGAFTGADSTRMGVFEAADGGTVFLDEIGELPMSLQTKLLRVLESGEVRRVGEVFHKKVDVRFIAATNKDLIKEVEDGRFREDLFYRIAVIQVQVPPLRDRRDDVLPLARHFLQQLASPESAPLELTPEEEEYLLRHPWPGNVRQLRNVVHRMITLKRAELPALMGQHDHDGYLARSALHRADGQAGPTPILTENRMFVEARLDVPFRDAKEQLVTTFERTYLERLWEDARGNLSQAARKAKLDRKHLRGLLRKHGIID